MSTTDRPPGCVEPCCVTPARNDPKGNRDAASGHDPPAEVSSDQRSTADRQVTGIPQRRTPRAWWSRLGSRSALGSIDIALVALGFEETVCYTDDSGVVQYAQLDWPEGGGVMLGAYKPEGPSTQQPGTTSVYVVATDPDAVLERAWATGADLPDEPSRRR